MDESPTSPGSVLVISIVIICKREGERERESISLCDAASGFFYIGRHYVHPIIIKGREASLQTRPLPLRIFVNECHFELVVIIVVAVVFEYVLWQRGHYETFNAFRFEKIVEYVRFVVEIN